MNLYEKDALFSAADVVGTTIQEMRLDVKRLGISKGR